MWQADLETHIARLRITPKATPRERAPLFFASVDEDTLQKNGLRDGYLLPLLSLDVWDYYFETVRVSGQAVRRLTRLRRCAWRTCLRFFEVEEGDPQVLLGAVPGAD